MLQGHFQLAASGETENLEDNEYIIADGTGGGKFDGDSSESTIVYLVKWGFHTNFVDYLLGSSTYGTDPFNPDQSNLYRDPPEQHPKYFPQFAVHADVRPEGFDKEKRDANAMMLDDQEWITANIARVTATFRALPYDVYTDEDFAGRPEYERYTFVENEFGMETISATGKMVFCSGNKQGLDHPPPIFAAVQNRIVHWYDIPADPNNQFVPANWWAIKQCTGRLNLTPFMNEPAQTVLCLSAKYTPKKPNAINGNRLFDVHMPVQIKNNGYGFNYYKSTSPKVIGVDAQDPTIADDYAGFNYFYNQYLGANSRFDLMTHDGSSTGRRTYLTAELNDLFKLRSS